MTATKTNRTPKSLAALLAACLSHLYPPRCHVALSLACDGFFTHWLSRQFDYLGKKVLLRRPLNVVGADNIRIGDASTVGKGSTLSVWKTAELRVSGLKIGHDTHIGEYAHITCANSIIIGDHVLTGRWLTITDNGHGDLSPELLNLPPIKRPLSSKGPVVIGNKVWIGDKVTILPGVTIGDQAIIGANAVVTANVPSKAMVGGNPARLLKQMP